MADIPQWRRKIPAARSRTPLLPEPENESRPPSASGTTRPPTPKRGLRPKLSSYLSHNGPFGTSTKPEPDIAAEEQAMPSFPSWAVEDPFPNPSADQLIDSLMCRLMSTPYDALEARFNSSLLQIFEAYRNVVEDRDQAKEKLIKEMDDHFAQLHAFQHAEQGWEDEIATYKAEVKRLELIIARGKRGVADVALARQDSLVRRRKLKSLGDENEDDGKETVLQFLEKTMRHEDPAWSAQRATMKTRADSPSARMTRLSRKLNQKTSMTSIHADLPFGTPPPELPRPDFLQNTLQEDQAARLDRKRPDAHNRTLVKPRPSLSDDSSWSCSGDLLPDEIGSHGGLASNESGKDTADRELADTDLTDMRQLAATISRRRGLSEGDVLPKLLLLFNESGPSSATAGIPEQASSELAPLVSTKQTAKAAHSGPARRPSHIKSLLNRLRPQLNLESTTLGDRRFSFEVGDDTKIHCQQHALQSRSRESLLRKSVSLSSLSDRAQKHRIASSAMKLSPIDHSPANSVGETESRGSSKIPSPTYGAATLARPRQERDDSMSSLMTAFRHDEPSAQRTSSMGSSAYSTPSAKRPHSQEEEPGPNVSWKGPARHPSIQHTAGTSDHPRNLANSTEASSTGSFNAANKPSTSRRNTRIRPGPIFQGAMGENLRPSTLPSQRFNGTNDEYDGDSDGSAS